MKVQDENWKAALTRLINSLAEIADAAKTLLDREIARKEGDRSRFKDQL